MQTIEEQEPWVDMEAVAKHFGFSALTIARMADADEIPCIMRKSGIRRYRRFKLSQVDAALSQSKVKDSR